jgi:hypothetical protein
MPQSQVRSQLRAAVASGAYGEVERLLELYRNEVEQLWHATPEQAQRQAIAQEVTSLLRWSRHAILAARAHTQTKLIQFHRQRAYAPSGSRPRGIYLDT